MGSSRDIAIGPVAVVSLLLGTLLQNEIPDPQANKLAYRRLAFTATFFAGITQFALGFFRSSCSLLTCNFSSGDVVLLTPIIIHENSSYFLISGLATVT